MKIGFGFDVHRLEKGYKLFIGGIDIPHEKGAVGHSDADALTHAVCDALLGAMGEGDLGTYYPSSNSAFKNMNSLEMLKGVKKKLADKGFSLVNLDSTVLAEAPRLSQFLADMKESLAKTLEVDPTLVNVKVKSGDRLGAIGRREGIGAQAVCLIRQHTSGV